MTMDRKVVIILGQRVDIGGSGGTEQKGLLKEVTYLGAPRPGLDRASLGGRVSLG